MTAVRLTRLGRPGVLESIAPERLFALLQPFTAFFASWAVQISPSSEIDCQAVISVITNADHDTPADLLDAICLIDELSNANSVDLLLDRVHRKPWGLRSEASTPKRTSSQPHGYLAGISWFRRTRYRESSEFALTTTFKRAKPQRLSL